MGNEYDIHSIEFYKLMAQTQADRDKNGEIDTTEQAEYDKYMSLYDMDKNGVYDENDVQLKKEASIFTNRERRYQYDLNEYIKNNNLDLNDLSRWSKEQREKYNQLCEGANLLKRLVIDNFKNACIDTILYLNNLGRTDEANNYMQSFNNTYGN